jgi:hypothetical protein
MNSELVSIAKTFFTSFALSYFGVLVVLVLFHAIAHWCGLGGEGLDDPATPIPSKLQLCTDCEKGNEQLFDPMFNIRETTKQLILLEDHLAHASKHCVDCVSKHLLFAEGLLEEAVTLDKKAQYASITADAIRDVKAASVFFAKHRFAKALDMQQMIRRTRKSLVKQSFDSIHKPTTNSTTQTASEYKTQHTHKSNTQNISRTNNTHTNQ